MVPDEGRIDLRGRRRESSREVSDDEPEFMIGDSEGAEHSERELMGKVEGVPEDELSDVAMKSYSKVKVKFENFVNLIASHAYEDVFEKHADEDVILSTDLLADLANAHEEKKDRKVPLIFVFGILLGIGVTYILLKY
jgi:hypothetical protein